MFISKLLLIESLSFQKVVTIFGKQTNKLLRTFFGKPTWFLRSLKNLLAADIVLGTSVLFYLIKQLLSRDCCRHCEIGSGIGEPQREWGSTSSCQRERTTSSSQWGSFLIYFVCWSNWWREWHYFIAVWNEVSFYQRFI